jgi:aspartate/methionine/tyrosine aminotransferase
MRSSCASEYLHWVKTRKPAGLYLASSGILPCPIAELGAGIGDLEINGPGGYGYEPLQHAIAQHCRVPADCVVAASGTSMANFLVMSTLIEPGDEVLIEHPVYEPLLAVARYLGADIKRFPRTEGTHDVVSSRTRLIVTTNLHNPTCAQRHRPELEELQKLARAVGAKVLIDEVYLECLYGQVESAFHLGKEFVSTGSLTKAYGLGGLRCGWILAEPDLARRLWTLKDLIDPSTPHPSERLSVMAFRHLDRLAARAKSIVERNRALLADVLRSCPELELAVPDYGTCVFPRLISGDAERLFELLHNRFDTDVVPGRFFEMPDHFRIGIGGTTEDLAEGLQRLQAALKIVG